jgi:gluconokinase
LTGKYQVDHGIASATGLFDIRRLEWYPESLALAGIDAGRLSEPVPCTHTEATLVRPVGREGTPLVIGGGDGCLANLGSSAVQPGETALTIGTSGAIRMTAAAPEDDPEGRIFNYILSADRYAVGGATNNGGNVLKWFFDEVLQVKEGDEGEWQRRMAAAEEVPPGCEGLIFLPYLQGERAPIWDADARAVFFGVRAIHDHRHFTRACLEGISYSLCQIGASLEETVGRIQHIYASGGFTRSDMWLQLIADVFLKKVHLTGVADSSAIGAAIMGFLALGLIDNLDAAKSLIQVVRTYEPNAVQHAAYQENYLIFTQLYGRLRDLMH